MAVPSFLAPRRSLVSMLSWAFQAASASSRVGPFAPGHVAALIRRPETPIWLGPSEGWVVEHGHCFLSALTLFPFPADPCNSRRLLVHPLKD